MEDVNEKLAEYIVVMKELTELRKVQREVKKKVDELEKYIKEYMTQNNMESITVKGGEIVLYPRKISQTYRKETIVEKLTEKLNDSKKAEELTESIITNKKFIVEDKVRAVMNK